jgi:predicted ATPase
MLKSFIVDNFKSLINVTFEPFGLNLLVGRNNAGKSTLCHALRFLSLSSQMSLDEAAAACTAEPWNLLNVYVPKDTLTLTTTCNLSLPDEELSFTYELSISSKAATGPQRGQRFAVSKELLRVSGGGFSDKTLFENNRGKVRLLHERRFLRGLASGAEPDYIETTSPTDTTMLYRLFDLETNQRANLFKRYLASWGYFNFEPQRLRGKSARTMDSVLDSTGSNLSSVIYTLYNSQPRVAKALVAAVQEIEPRLDLFSFQTPDPEHVYMFFEDRQGHPFGVDNVSDGTLRYLAISYLVLTGQRQADRVGTPTLMMIEEPENGIFVGNLKTLLQTIDPSGRGGQFIFTSHNPYFIDLFDANLEGLFLIKSGDIHSRVIKPDPAMLQDRLGKFSLGEMLFRGLLE